MIPEIIKNELEANEEARIVDGYDHYFVTNRGRVFSTKYKRAYMLKPSEAGYGYLFVNLSKNNKQKQRYVHHLVLEAFDRKREEREECRHLNGDRFDNRIDNLEWGSSKDNSHDCRKHGTTRSKLSDNTVLTIRKQYRQGKHTYKDLASVYDVHETMIGHIVRGEAWAHVGGPVKGRDYGKRGSGGGNYTLNTRKVKEMRRLREDGHEFKDLADRFDVCVSTARMVCNRVRWKHV